MACPPRRVTNWNLNHTYPDKIGFGIYAQGQYRASCNRVAWSAIGREQMDKAILRGLDMTTASSVRKVAAEVIITAAVAMS